MSKNRRTFLMASGALMLGGVSGHSFAAKIKPDTKSVLIVVDVQNCFVPGGCLFG